MRASYSVESSWSSLRTGRSVLVLSFLKRIFRVVMMRGLQGGLGLDVRPRGEECVIWAKMVENEREKNLRV